MEFSKSDSVIRIIVVTESLGTGMDLSDIKQVIQYRFPLNWLLSILIQYFGHTVSLPDIEGEAIFLVES